MNKSLLLTIATVLLCCMSAHSVNKTDYASTDKSQAKEPFKFEIYGFVRNDFTYDSRTTLASVSELFSFIPYDQELNALGQDVNAIPSTRFLSVVSRFGFNATSPLYGGKLRLSAKIEADFCGHASFIQLLRIRQAHVTLRWPHHSLLVGQAWHPMSGDLLPSIVSLNTGAPFNAFTRAPQLRYDAFIGPITLSAAAIYQFQYPSPGPEGNTTKYQLFGGLPELYLGVSANGKRWRVGLGAEYLQICPRHFIGDTRINASVRSVATQLFADYHTEHFTVRAKSIYGQNLGHLLMMSGYGEYYTNPADPTTIQYTPIAQSATWATLAYHTTRPIHNLRATLLLGYMKNLGASHTITGQAYMRGFDNIDQIYRIAPSIQYSYRHLNVGLEYEYTAVAYGNVNPNYSVIPTHLIDNHRIYLICVYNFSHIFLSKK